jgi:hypothetical protein
MLDRNVISINEYRESMGMPPIEEPEEPEEPEEKENESIQEAVKLGVIAGLKPLLNPVVDTETTTELKRWQKMAVKRYIEGKPEKALLFTSDIIPDTLGDKIKSALATVDTVDSVKMIFKDARLYNA